MGPRLRGDDDGVATGFERGVDAAHARPHRILFDAAYACSRRIEPNCSPDRLRRMGPRLREDDNGVEQMTTESRS